jgi:hypothetical protein
MKKFSMLALVAGAALYCGQVYAADAMDNATVPSTGPAVDNAEGREVKEDAMKAHLDKGAAKGDMHHSKKHADKEHHDKKHHEHHGKKHADDKAAPAAK